MDSSSRLGRLARYVFMAFIMPLACANFVALPTEALSIETSYEILPDTIVADVSEDLESLDISAMSTHITDLEDSRITYSDAFNMNVNSSSGIPLEFWRDYLPSDLAEMADGLVYCDDAGINSLYLYAVAVTEVGRNCHTVGEHNYFNYTTDAKSYQDFASPLDCFEYTADRYTSAYFLRDWQLEVPIDWCDMPPRGSLNYDDEVVTITEINRRYAINSNLTVNWEWQALVAEIISATSEDYIEWATTQMESWDADVMVI